MDWTAASSSSGVTTSPLASTRSGISSRNRGRMGGRFSSKRRSRSVPSRGRCQMSLMPLNPCVTSSPTFAPLPWTSRLVPTVVPCESAPTPASPSLPWNISITPSMIDRLGSAGVDGTLSVSISPVSWSITTRSVNVPPVSTATVFIYQPRSPALAP